MNLVKEKQCQDYQDQSVTTSKWESWAKAKHCEADTEKAKDQAVSNN